ncbi:MAG: cytochrome P450 [Gammaproteobacteria bacterium]|jgi:cytochrome P450
MQSDDRPDPKPLTNSSAPHYSRYNPMSSAVRVDPYPYYRYLREHEPVKYIPELNGYAVSRNADVRAVLLDHKTFSSDPLIQLAFGEGNPAPDAQYMIACDPPDHTRLRTLVNKAFSRRMLETQRPEITRIVSGLIEEAASLGEFEFIDTLASPLPVQIVGQIMGIETSMRTTFRRWSNSVTAGGNADTLSDIQRIAIHKDADEFRAYFEDRITHARRNPSDDLISALVAAEESGDRLNADEVLAMCILLLIAGNETTTSLLANALVCLREFPDQEKLIRADRTLVANFTEESLRYLAPVQVLFRRATCPTEIAGVKIPENAIVLPIYGSANRDEAVFENPDVVDVTRTDLRQHMAFSWGIHLCVGRALALLEGELAINHLFDRFKQIEITQDEIEWCDAFYLRSPKTLQVRCR